MNIKTTFQNKYKKLLGTLEIIWFLYISLPLYKEVTWACTTWLHHAPALMRPLVMPCPRSRPPRDPCPSPQTLSCTSWPRLHSRCSCLPHHRDSRLRVRHQIASLPPNPALHHANPMTRPDLIDRLRPTQRHEPTTHPTSEAKQAPGGVADGGRDGNKIARTMQASAMEYYLHETMTYRPPTISCSSTSSVTAASSSLSAASTTRGCSSSRSTLSAPASP
jgi:hypothetical protein